MVTKALKELATSYNGLIRSWLNTATNSNLSDKAKVELLAQSMQEWLNRETI